MERYGWRVAAGGATGSGSRQEAPGCRMNFGREVFEPLPPAMVTVSGGSRGFPGGGHLPQGSHGHEAK